MVTYGALHTKGAKDYTGIFIVCALIILLGLGVGMTIYSYNIERKRGDFVIDCVSKNGKEWLSMCQSLQHSVW